MRAAALFAESLDLYREQRDTAGIAVAVTGVARIAWERGQRERAARLFGVVDALHEIVGLRPTGGADPRPGMRLAAQAFPDASAAGRALSIDLAADEAMRLASGLATTGPSAPSIASAHPGGLSEREAEVLGLIARGLTNAQAAERLFLSPRTVDAHLRRIYDKLGANTRADAVRFAGEHDIA